MKENKLVIGMPVEDRPTGLGKQAEKLRRSGAIRQPNEK